MHNIFKISSTDIQALDDTQARELVAMLCKAELLSKKLGTSFVTWGGDQRAKDGGVDVRVDINPVVGVSGYIPNDATAYQVKAESFGPAKVLKEMAPKSVIRNAISEFSKQGGAYIIVSTRDDLSDSSLNARKKAMADCLVVNGITGSVHLDFYDSRKIADWVMNFPATVAWLRNELGRPLDGWQSYGPWAYYEKTVDDEYLVDEKIKIFTPNTEEGLDITSSIDQLRGEIIKSGMSVRIVGLSGVGKTRFVQALFDSRILTSNCSLNKDSVIYTDLSNNPTPQPIAMLESLHQQDSDIVVVVDNCGQDIHQKLTEIVKRPNCKVRLVTIEYDIRDGQPEGTNCYRLEGSSDEVIAKLLKRHYQTLSDLDINKIVEFSDGNARVAFALASTSEIKGELAQLKDNALFQRLFHQKKIASDELLKCAEAASLLYSFDIEDISEKSELAILSSISEVTIQTFYRNIYELKQRGLVQERGKWRAVLPHAIANRLALTALQAIPPNILIQKFITDSSERVARSFSRRLGFLHESKQAQDIVNEWLKSDGLLGDVAKLDELKRQILNNIAPVNQRAALNALLRTAKSKDFISTSNKSRAKCARLLRYLAYEQDLFEEAVEVLLAFALENPEDSKSDEVRDILKSLFYLQLSGTIALLEQRAKIVRALALSGIEIKQRLALDLLRAGLESNYFTCNYGFEFGALKRDYGWRPKTLEEFEEWYSLFISIAVELGKTFTSIGSDARSLLGSTFRGLWTNARMHKTLTNAATELVQIDGWPDGWIGIRNTLHWDKERMDSSSFDALKALEKKLTPQDLLAKIQAKVLSNGYLEADLDDGPTESAVARYNKTQKEAQELGKAAAHDNYALADLALYISVACTNDKSWHFGFGIGQEAIAIQGMFDCIRAIIEKAEIDNLNTLFIRGLIAGWNKTKPKEVSIFLDNAVNDQVWGQMFPELQFAIGLDKAAHNRLIKCLEFGKAPTWQFKYLGMERVTDALSIEQLASLINLVGAKPDGGLAVAIDLLCMVIHCLDNKSSEYRYELQAYCSKFISEIDWNLIDLGNHNFTYHLEKLFEFTLEGTVLHKDALKALNNLVNFELSSPQYCSFRAGRILSPYFKFFPKEALNACYIQDADKSYNTALRMLTDELDRDQNTAVSGVQQKFLIDWCKLSPEDRFIFAARTCKLLEKSNSTSLDDGGNVMVSSTANAVLAHAPDKKKVLNIFISRFQPTIWSGSLAAIMNQRLHLLDKLNPTKDVGLQALIETTKVKFSNLVAAEEKREQERERSRTSSFE